MIRVLIIDDERLARAELRRLLSVHSDVEILGEAANALEAHAMIEQLHPDLLLLDIQMPGGTGFDLLQSLDQVPATIFTTAYDQYAIQAFEVNALDYLLKPVESERLAKALQRAGASNKREDSQASGKLFIKDGNQCWFVDFERIRLFEAEGNYTRVYFDTHRPLILRTLAQFETALDPRNFIRVSRQHIVNMVWVEHMETLATGGMELRLRDGQLVNVSRRRATELKAAARL